MESILSVLTPSEALTPTSPLYARESQVWAAQKDKHPKLVARPQTIESLSRLLQALDGSDLEFNVRGGGCGSASASDVLISMSAFDGFEFDREKEMVTVGAGQIWRDVDRKMEEQAAGYSVPGARCTYVGVGGGTLQGGVSWMSSEYGLTSDPQNMLDAQIVLMDGTVKWASSDPDLLWALRGGGGRFGVVTAFKLKAYEYPQKVYSGMILFGREALPELVRKVPEFVERNTDPKVAMHFYCLDMMQGAFVGKPSVAGLGLLVYDAHGEEHGRGEAFKWALEIPGAVDTTKGMSYRQVNQLNDGLEVTRGKSSQMMMAVVVPNITGEFIERTWKWFDEALIREPKLNAGTFVLIEIMQKAAFDTAKSRADTGWPRPGGRHILQLGCGALKENSSDEIDVLATKLMEDGGREICGDQYSMGNCLPRDFEEFHSPVEIFGENVEKLREIKARVDPRNRLRGAYTV